MDDPRQFSAEALRKFTNEEQDPAVVEQVLARVRDLMTEGEDVLYVAVQRKPLVTIAPESVVLTTRRFMVFRPRVLGGADFEDHIWRELQDVDLKEGLVGATLTLNTVAGKQIVIEYLPKAQARRLYAFAQQMEERALEERRLRQMEEARAAAGGVYVQGQPSAAPAPPPAADPVQRLKQLKDMLDAGLITAQEYESKKAEILSRL